MRAVVLSDDRIIKRLNDNFINTWIRNVDLRHLRDTLGVERLSPLARTLIQNRRWRGPVDTWVLSPDLEALGHVAVNDYLGENRREDGTLESENYLLFLEESLAGKFPGFDNTVLTPEQPSHSLLGVFRTPDYGHQDYTVVVIDTTAFENGGTLTIDMELGNETGYGAFVMLDADQKLSYDAAHKRPEGRMLSEAHDVSWYGPCETGQIVHRFDRGQIFKWVALGWASNEKGSVNAFRALLTVAPKH